MDERIVTVTYSDISTSGLKVTLERSDNTFVVDYPVWCDFSDGWYIVSYNNPEIIPSEIRDTIEDIIRYTREYESSHCHCGSTYNGSDHCPNCFCEVYEMIMCR
jgi:hypothetical protein